jgi:hypothetical protein
MATGQVTTMKIEGIDVTIKALKEWDPQFRKAILKRAKKAGEPALIAARSMIPTAEPPLSGMRRGSLIQGRDGTAWSSSAAVEGFKIITNRSAKKARNVTFKSGEKVSFGAQPYQLLTLQQKNAAAAIWDHAGKNTKGLFAANLTAYGKGKRDNPRAADPAVDEARPAIESEVKLILHDMETQLNIKLKVH